jgi:hypothetical protein
MNVPKSFEVRSSGLVFRVEANTECSLCLRAFSDASGLAKGSVLGWLDVHYPCAQRIRVQMRGVLPERVLIAAELRHLVVTICDALHIPSNEACDAVFSSPKMQMGITVLLGPEARTGRIDTTRRFELPKEEGEENHGA